MTGYPIQIAKVQAPPLRDDTLARPRLLDWLSVKIHNRLVLLIAEAGYGKTTLLADFARRTRVRTIWYRLDDTDRGWAPFIAHLVAAAREHEPDFAPATFQLLRELGPAGPSRDTVLNAYLRELPAFCSAAVALVIDDFHLVDDADEVADVVRDLVTRAPERFTIVIASRRRPTLPMARLRSLGEVAELTVNDLRFDVSETASLFRDAYRLPLDGDTVAELTRRTEGWAASLQLVQAAVRDRNARETRAFIRTLSGAEGDLYDYLAEEVVGHLSPEMQRFLMRISLLETVEPDLAAVAADVDVAHARSLIASAERYGLLSRRGTTRGTFRFHPLVREFLGVRLAREVSREEVLDLHRSLAAASKSQDWRRAVFHYAEAGDWSEASLLISTSLEHILAAGQYAEAEGQINRMPLEEEPASFQIIKSRAEYRRGHIQAALQHARAAVEIDQDSDIAVLNLLSLSFTSRDLASAARLASLLGSSGKTEATRTMANLYVQLLGSATTGSLTAAVATFTRAAEQYRREGNHHYEGIALTNASVMLRAMGDSANAYSVASTALAALDISSAGPERASARMVRSWAQAHAGSLREARAEAEQARLDGGLASLAEVYLERADIEIWYGELEAARQAIDAVPIEPDVDTDQAEQRRLTIAGYLLRSGDLAGAAEAVNGIRLGQPSTAAGMEARRLSILAHLSVASGASGADRAVHTARTHAARQAAGFWLDYTGLLEALAGHGSQLNGAIRACFQREAPTVGLLAELVVHKFADLDGDVVVLLADHVRARPDRWRELLREALHSPIRSTQLWAARLLDEVGQRGDVLRLRKFVRSIRGSPRDIALGRQLARRLAERVVVHDQNRVSIWIGARTIQGTDVRRKALALLCFLLTRPAFSATRDEVLEALWPDMDPTLALNSLNQTIYFLRRVFEPDFSEDLSPGYLRYQSDVVWLDTELVDSTSARCRRLMASAGKMPNPTEVEELSMQYEGRFALDFAYEDWATDYREALHASYLALVEDAVKSDAASGHFSRGALVARRALDIDPDAHQIERLLVKVYRLSGAHAAAAEQYGHYAASLREDLGVEPAKLEDL